MKWISLIVGGAIVIAGIWLLMKPSDVNGPTPDEVGVEESMMDNSQHEGVMEDGTLESSDTGAAAGTQLAGNPSTAMDTDGAVPPFAQEEEPMGDPIFHALVEYTDAGFSPKTVTISKGETVRFVNTSSSGVWVGGNNHPSHTQYPEKSADDCLGTSFDTCRVLEGAAEFWEFTFNEVGTWGYHNHIRSNNGGTVVVN